ncbi:hypothetical protein [Virgibacillus sp.]|uniref:hypothetical protein n=1 Tax=Virgibacillus sp. TaxID=1872700 RepID=UPI001823CEA6|nr:hypothetical protein [Virgibacillus sp.]NWO12689.1 hypothetical protein [Virgibacillus sp.]
MVQNKEKKRLTLTGNKMPEEIYKKLEELGSTRRLTPYIVSLVEKEQQTNQLIESLSSVAVRMEGIEHKVDYIYETISSGNISTYKGHSSEEEPEEIVQGDIDVSDKIIGGIEEEIEDIDF